jgi:hypothetical protein
MGCLIIVAVALSLLLLGIIKTVALMVGFVILGFIVSSVY